VAKATGIGPALRRARLVRGKSIGEASRETRIRAEYLQALERERFDNLLGDVYVRGFLRSYASYLGLDPEKVVSLYSVHFGPPMQPQPPVPPAPPTARRSRPRRVGRGPLGRIRVPSLHALRLNWPVMLVLAVTAIVVLSIAGLFARSNTAPAAATGVGGALPIALGTEVTIAVQARVDVHTTIIADGHLPAAFDGILRAGEGVSVQAEHTLQIRMERGASAQITVNGNDLGAPGSSKEPYLATFGPKHVGSEPSVGPSVG
jgi:hypothetical protein